MQVEAMLTAIEEDIVFGVMPAHARLVEDRLIERFDAKRHMVREVFARLEDLGLLVRFPNRGAVVAELTPDEVRSIYDVREMLETGAAYRTRLPASLSVTEEMSRVQEKHSLAVEEEDFRAVFRHNIDFHKLQYSACENPYLVQSIQEFARKAHLIRAVKYGDKAHMRKVIDQHWSIITAMRGSDHDLLARLIREHMPGSPEEYVRLYEIRHGMRPQARRAV